jgi:hypothetical protein
MFGSQDYLLFLPALPKYSYLSLFPQLQLPVPLSGDLLPRQRQHLSILRFSLLVVPRFCQLQHVCQRQMALPAVLPIYLS